MGPRTLDLFCGGGGSSYGARGAGASIACGVDGWPYAAETYGLNFPKARLVNQMLDEATVPEDLGDLGKIDLLLASPECTHHTCARGNRPRREESKRTANYVLNFARELRPRWVVIENVVHMKEWRGYEPLITNLMRLGYHVRPVVLDASRLGVPQSRRRLFLLCDSRVMPREVPLRRGRTPTGKSILDRPGTWQSRPVTEVSHAPETLKRIERGVVQVGRGVPFLVVYYGSDGAGGWHPLDRPLRTVTTLDRFGLLTWEGNMKMMRMLQVSELRRAMGFDMLEGEFRFPQGSRRDRIKVLGNGVCPPVMKAIVETLTGIGQRA
jgi:DNA (cytosine-5)-methyltransferase 1